MTRWSESDLARVSARMKNPRVSGQTSPSKYGNRKCVWQEQAFDSERERDAYKDFRTQELAGAIRSVIRQVSMCLPGTSRRIRVDFLVIEPDGTHRWFDAKGFETQAWRLKRSLVKDGYGITIELI